MGLSISDEELKPVQSGTALRFTVTLCLDNDPEVGQSQKGYMAFRSADGTIDVKPPVTPLRLRGRPIKYYAASITPKAVVAIRKYLEDNWGDKIKGSEDWNELRAESLKETRAEGWKR